MHRFGLKTVFSKLFASVMLTLVFFAIAMIALTHLVHDNSTDMRWQILAKQIVNQIDPFVDELDNAMTMNERLQARFMLAVVRKSFDIFDQSLDAKMGLYDREGHLLIQTGNSDLPKVLPEDPSWISRMLPTLSSSPIRNSVQAVGDRGYTLLYEPRNPPKRSELSAVLNLFTGTLLLLGIMTLVLWWIARSMTWRLNEMSHQMTQLGEGNFSVRVPTRGNDEIANLAHGFNQAAQKIEQLINANSLLLAHASHEFRTPITRIRLQIEMMEMLSSALDEKTQAKFFKRSQAVKQDLTGLNELVESILLVSRLDAGHAAEKNEHVNLYKLVNQECQHYPDITFFGSPIVVEGQPKLLTHLIRNLLNNAMVHGKPPIEIQLYGVMTLTEATTPPEDLLTLIGSANNSNADAKQNALTDENTSKTKTTAETPNTLLKRFIGFNNAHNDNVSNNNLESASANNLDMDNEASTVAQIKRTAFNPTQIVNAVFTPITTALSGRITASSVNTSSPIHNATNNIDNTTADTLTPKPSSSKNKSKKASKKAETAQNQAPSTGLTKLRLKWVAKSGTYVADTIKTKSDKTKAATANKPAKSSDSGFTKRLRRTKPAKIAPKVVANYAVLAVIDNGKGIPFAKRQEIFTPFVRLQQKKKGSGLGLSLVAQIVEAHHGRITTDTYEDRTRFLVILPTHRRHALKPNTK